MFMNIHGVLYIVCIYINVVLYIWSSVYIDVAYSVYNIYIYIHMYVYIHLFIYTYDTWCTVYGVVGVSKKAPFWDSP